MTRVWLPDSPEAFGGLPAGIESDLWKGGEDLPPTKDARGAIVDTDALLAELGRGRLRAALDVTDPEPLPDGHPLWSAPGLLLTPHVGGAVRASSQRAYAVVKDQLTRLAAGEPLLNVIGPDGY